MLNPAPVDEAAWEAATGVPKVQEEGTLNRVPPAAEGVPKGAAAVAGVEEGTPKPANGKRRERGVTISRLITPWVPA